MLQRLKTMIDHIVEPQKDARALPVSDYRLAAAALLVHATLIDGKAENCERDKLRQLLCEHFGLKEQDVDEFIKLAEREESNAIDLYGFTRQLTKELDAEGRMEIIEMLWEIAYSDGVLHDYEQHLIWRVAGLLHVTTRDRVRLRKQVEARMKKA